MNTEYVAALDSLKETLNNSNDLTSFASEFIKQYKLMERNRIKSLQKQNTKEIFCVRHCCCCWKDWEEMQMRKVLHQSSFRGSQNFAIFTAIHLCWSLFLIKLQRLAKSIQHRGFPVNIVKLFRTPISKNICKLLLLIIFVYEKIFYISTTKCFA